MNMQNSQDQTRYTNASFKILVSYFLFFLPIILIIIQSYFRKEFIFILNLINLDYGAFLYYVVRIVLFAMFATILFYIKLPRIYVHSVNDIYVRERTERDPLLGLRGLACFNVFFGHWFLIACNPSLPAVQNWDYVLRVMFSGSPWCGLWIFFTLSGYLITKGFVSGRHPLDNKGLMNYYKNRILRIMPLYFTAIFLVAWIAKPEYLNFFDKVILIQLLEHITFDIQGGGIIGALWSVSTEFQFYLIAPLLTIILIIINKLNYKYLFFAAPFILILFAYIKYLILFYRPETWHSHVYFPLILNLDCFLCGGVVSLAVENLRRSKFYIKNGICIGIILTLFAQIIFSLWSYPEMVAYPGVPGSNTRIYYLSIAPGFTAVATGCIIFLFDTARRSDGSYNLAWRISTFSGVVTYCLYVLHEPIFLAIQPFLKSSVTIIYSITIMPVALILCVGCASIAYKFIEKPFNSFKSTKSRPSPV